MYRRKQHKRRNKHSSERIEPRNDTYKPSQNNHNNNYNNNYSKTNYRPSTSSKKQRLIQVEQEIADIVFEDNYKNGDEYDKLMLERFQLRFLLNQ